MVRACRAGREVDMAPDGTDVAVAMDVEDSKVAWNFSKYLVDGKGKYVGHFGSKAKPMSVEITNSLD